ARRSWEGSESEISGEGHHAPPPSRIIRGQSTAPHLVHHVPLTRVRLALLKRRRTVVHDSLGTDALTHQC
ncbi:MAG: hypothetical protein ABJ015_17275, partial [Rhodopirellula bahusiensis]